MSRQLVRLVFIGLVSIASSWGVLAQEARLVMRAAVTPYPAGGVGGRDTTGMVRSELEGDLVYLGEVLLSLGNGSLLMAGAEVDPLTGQSKVSIELAEAEAGRFAEITANRIEQAIAIVLDGQILSAPTVQSRILNGRVEITGFMWDEAQDLAAGLREATGARSLEEGRRQKQIAFRAEIDLTTPEGAADTFLRAVAVRDWLTLGELFHPDALPLFREGASQMLVVHADSVSRVPPSDDGLPIQPEQHRGYVYAIADLLETTSAGSSLDALSDAQVATLLLAVASEWWLPEVPDYSVQGAVFGAPGVAYVIVDASPEFLQMFDEMSPAKVLTFRQHGASWRLLYSATGW